MIAQKSCAAIAKNNAIVLAILSILTVHTREALMLISIENINTTGTQSRVSVNGETVAEYAAAIDGGAVLPPVVVYKSGDGQHWLADGFHRIAAHIKAGRTEIKCDIRDGGQRAAILHSVGANATHGLKRTNADKRRAVEMLLSDPEWSQWSDREIARACCVTHTFIRSLRQPVTGNVSSEKSYTTKHGTQSTMRTDGINADRKTAQKAPQSAKQPDPIPSHDDDGYSSRTREEELEQQLRETADCLADAVAALDDLGSPDRDDYLSSIAKLRAELNAVTVSRDALMNENAALKKHIRMLEKQLKK